MQLTVKDRWWIPLIRCLALPALLLLAVIPARAEEGGCRLSAASWYEELDQKEQALLERRTADQCAFSARWIREQSFHKNIEIKRRTCSDLVLIWTHKECTYLRDYVDRRAYEPCKEWSRRMNEHCLADDEDWFLR